MIKFRYSLLTLLVTVTIATGALLEINDSHPAIAQATNNTTSTTDVAAPRHKWIPLVITISSVGLASFIIQKALRSRRSRPSQHRSIDYYEAEFGCGPVARFSSQSTDTATSPETSPNQVAEASEIPHQTARSSNWTAPNTDTNRDADIQDIQRFTSPELQPPELESKEDGNNHSVSEPSGSIGSTRDMLTNAGLAIPNTESSSAESSSAEHPMTDAPTPETPSLRDRYLTVIDQIVNITLKGQLRSKEQIYQQLVDEISTGTGEIFERCLQMRLDTTKAQVDNAIDEIKQARASRTLRALQAIQGEWERYQVEQKVTGAIATATQAILTAPDDEQFTTWIRWIDPNHENGVALDQLNALSQALEKGMSEAETPDSYQYIRQLIAGIRKGVESCQRLDDYLIRWVYEVPSSIGFEGTPKQWGPWKLWSQKAIGLLPKQLFQTLADNQSVSEFVRRQSSIGLQDCAELVIVLQYLQSGLVAWFEKQPYDSKWGTKQSIATFLTFAVIWSQLSIGFEQSTRLSADDRQKISQGCFQLILQGLRTFSQQSFFPLYGGVFALLSGEYLKDTLNYLDVPLRQVKGTQEKARILTLLGYSQRALGNYDRSIEFHQQALEIAQAANDQPCVIANLNHLSRTYVTQKNYTDAIGQSQRALVLARQVGDRLGEANALTNLGYSEVLSARQLERIEPESCEMAISYLQQGLTLSEKLGDRQSQSLCYNSLGIAYVILEQAETAIPYLEKGVQTAQMSGDFYLQGLNFSYLAEAHYGLGHREQAVAAAFLGMYLLDQIQASEWRQPAELLTLLEGQLGDAAFQTLRAQARSIIIAVIGVDGYDHLPQLLETYKRSLN